MQRLFCLITLAASTLFALPSQEWRKVNSVGLLRDRCISQSNSNELCAFEFNSNGLVHTKLYEAKTKNEPFQTRELLHLVDTSTVCEGSHLSVARFFNFEKRDVDHDGVEDLIVLIKAGKVKRKPTEAEPCPHPSIGTAIYEIVYLSRGESFQMNPDSELIVRRLQSLNTLAE